MRGSTFSFGHIRLVLADRDWVRGLGEVATFDTQVPLLFGSTGAQPAEILSIFGRPGERVSVPEIVSGPRDSVGVPTELGLLDLRPHHDGKADGQWDEQPDRTGGSEVFPLLGRHCSVDQSALCVLEVDPGLEGAEPGLGGGEEH